jgi:hypothetical protein
LGWYFWIWLVAFHLCIPSCILLFCFWRWCIVRVSILRLFTMLRFLLQPRAHHYTLGSEQSKRCKVENFVRRAWNRSYSTDRYIYYLVSDIYFCSVWYKYVFNDYLIQVVVYIFLIYILLVLRLYLPIYWYLIDYGIKLVLWECARCYR